MSFEKQNYEKFNKSLTTNVSGIFLVTKIFYKLLQKSKNPQIINFGSIYGVRSPDFKIYGEKDRINSEIYGGTKAAIIQITKYFILHNLVSFSSNRIYIK